MAKKNSDDGCGCLVLLIGAVISAVIAALKSAYDWATRSWGNLAFSTFFILAVIGLIYGIRHQCKLRKQAILNQKASDFEKARQLNPFFKKYDRGSYRFLSGSDFEIWTTELLEVLGYTNVIHTKASGDFGVDVIGTLDGVKYALQCKQYSSSVGPSAVQEVTAGMAHYGCQKGVVVTNSTFTSSAVILARENDIELWDGSMLDRMYESAIKYVLKNAEKKYAN